ncbi:restriction endonuclease subunit S [Clostridioides difficile]|nr:restriction endonuclease subunit S [Clostridioides difficile]
MSFNLTDKEEFLNDNQWEEVKLGEVCELITRGITPSYIEESGVVVINQKCIRDNRINLELSRLTNSEKKKIPEQKYLKDYDVLVNSTGVGTLGRVAQIKKIKNKLTVDSHVTIVRANSKIYPEFLGYNLFMQQPNIEHLAEGSTGQTELSRIRLGEAIKLLIPTLEEQKSIAHILSTLDKKIETNNQINKKLEEMAQAIFKQWFVDFEFPNEDGEPYKSSGGEIVESELGMIPKEWEVGTFRDYTDTVLGGDWGKENPHGNYTKEVYCLRGADIPEVRVGKKGALPKRYILEKNYNNKKLSHGDLVVEISGGSPTQSTGRITYISELMINKYEFDFVCTNFCRAITLKNKTVMEFFYFYWTQLYDLNIFFQYENGTTGIKNFDINTFLDKFMIVKPTKQVIDRFHNVVRNLLNTIQLNGSENIKLSQTRDMLLPKLMSGGIRVQ